MTDAIVFAVRSIADFESENVRLRGEVMRLETTVDSLLAKEAERTDRESEQRRRLAELEMLVTKDQMTGLLNRRGFDEAVGRYLSHVARALDHGGIAPRPATLVYIDLDRFKPVNDLLSHNIGDVLLMKFGSALRRTLWDTDYVARIGGDEFVVVLKNVGDRSVAEKIVEKVHRAVSNITIDGVDPEQLEMLFRATGRRSVLGFTAGYHVIKNAQLSVIQIIDLAERDVPKLSALRQRRGEYKTS